MAAGKALSWPLSLQQPFHVPILQSHDFLCCWVVPTGSERIAGEHPVVGQDHPLYSLLLVLFLSMLVRELPGKDIG